MDVTFCRYGTKNAVFGHFISASTPGASSSPLRNGEHHANVSYMISWMYAMYDFVGVFSWMYSIA
jgi:hypothetical protein